MALACVRQSRGPSRSNLEFCLIFKGFSLDCGRDPNNYRGRVTATRSGEKLPWTGKELPRFAVERSGKTNHGPRFAVRLVRFKARERGNANRD